ncbi:helix-turn-helix transcriptional regulator [Lactobacillus helveticus]|uniref:helix-turn-helix domain-containing protein n=1 Tax=Lactobacillus helveticus TaxID=1587 RepID=UPI00081A6C0A|nr:helix-turn-helix transcriptional regulator [Lactobacillus helveticus]ANZ56435.1 transcriptional regulator [Lactobacillus helveticus]AQY52873.1 transcriptional regulator [Lactobacillus helveticus]MBU6033978.1 helix-turn-helix transcriptional regulator [Lactobacillus helveticus]MBW1219444.1 helix-turn-helix transcriptional regulator [Lactobacillus helveticus]MDY0874971.1 helix-turn-helix transcriptional regulator [Lactobacillus helveticus]
MIEVTVDFMLLKRKMKSKDLAKAIGITPANLSILKTGKAHGVRFDTLSKIYEALDCQPGDLLKYVPDDEGEKDEK